MSVVFSEDQMTEESFKRELIHRPSMTKMMMMCGGQESEI
jgi:hypothetical protein